MRVTRGQLRRIIKEEKAKIISEEYGMGGSIEADMQNLLDYLRSAAERAAYIRTASDADVSYAEQAGGREADDLLRALQNVWTAFGMDQGDF